jgi:uncharacterized protein YndB with AHSA1/START domain
MNEALTNLDGRSVLHIERLFRHPAEKVWRAITHPGELRHWFPWTMDADLHVGGAIRFTYKDGQGPETEGRVLELDPPRLFSFLWGDSVLRFELRPEPGDGCRMLFSHTFDDQVSAASYAAGWQICFENLYLLLDGKPSDVGLDQWAALHDGYVEQFGLGAGSTDDAAEPGGGWVVRFERQLTRPVDEVWDLLRHGGPVAEAAAPPAGFVAGLQPPAGPGMVIVAEPPGLLEASWRVDGIDAGRLRWSLTPGNGGARLLLTQTVPQDRPGQVQAALDGWAEALEELAVRLRG